MTVTSIEKDLDNRTLTLIADFEASPEQVWELWADPRKLERWWGPPTYPATFEQHDLSAGGRASYFMTGPEGDTSHGWWEVAAVDPPKVLELVDGFADEQGNKATDMPFFTMRMELTEHDGGTRMEVRTVFESAEDMERLDGMGMSEGLREAVGQMDALLAA